MKKALLITALIMAITPSVGADLAGKAPIPVQKEIIVENTGPLVVDVKNTIAFKTSKDIAGISVGSPLIAGVAVHDQNLILITGRSYGSTSLHIIDELGNVFLDTSIIVAGASPDQVVLNSGGQNYTMSCTPICRPSPTIGDSPEYFNEITEQAETLLSAGE